MSAAPSKPSGAHAPPPFPDGLSEPHAAPRARLARHASPLSFLVLLAVILLALSGRLGGRGEPPLVALAEGADLTLDMPRTLRNGEFYEARIRILAKADIEETVLGVAPELWRDQTQNAIAPAASEESFEDGLFRFSYGPLRAGDALEIKIDSQINPASLGGTRGEVSVFDGAEALARLPVEIEVLP